YPVHGWVTAPDPARFGTGPHPVVLMIHGGPFAQYTHEVFDEVQVLAGAGYAVVHGNPRGSAGYGAAHGRAIHRAFGTVDADDVLALLAAALAEPGGGLDAARVGVMGGSYGGYLAAWLTTRTDRFTAAVVERGFLDPVSFVGSSDIGWFFGLEYLGDTGSPRADAALAAQSPMAHVGRVRTPTLVIHSEQDWRCPVEQGQRWFVELKRRGVPAELLLFPGEGHELTRSGRPRHRAARFEHVVDWWSRHLPV
ncbi:MAG TPA: prolyl oligopeptidase family serine peptidase, partial [Actinotalea sp.]|nr:prolyl oligopeptidase family serine peptidase [Actinotalea sp.]